MDPELHILMAEVAALTVGTSWEHIGIALGLPPSVINRIKHDKHDTNDAYQLMFDEWLQRQERRTWRDVIQALEENFVNEKALAFRLRSKLQRNARIAQQSFTRIERNITQLHSIVTESMQQSFLQERHEYHSIAPVSSPNAMLVPAIEINKPISSPSAMLNNPIPIQQTDSTRLLDNLQYKPVSELKKPIPKPRRKQYHNI